MRDIFSLIIITKLFGDAWLFSGTCSHREPLKIRVAFLHRLLAFTGLIGEAADASNCSLSSEGGAKLSPRDMRKII